MINYRPLVIGGPMDDDGDTYSHSVYRGDSFICSAAIHSGYLKDERGGCGVVKLVGERTEYPATKHHGIKSIGFHSYFPQSFGFVKDTSATCEDLRWPLLAVSVTYSVILSLFTTSPLVFFWSIFTGLFIHVALVSDPPGFSDYHSLISTAVGRFVPAAFCMAIMYLVAIRFTLRHLKAQIEKTILWLGACWVGSRSCTGRVRKAGVREDVPWSLSQLRSAYVVAELGRCHESDDDEPSAQCTNRYGEE